MSRPSWETGDPDILRGLLNSVDRDSTTTQRKLAGDLGIAVGLANAYVRRCVRKGFLKMNQVPMNRYVYYLTPQGFAEKSRLTAEYLGASLSFFRRARSDCSILLQEAAARGWLRIALYGAGELAEIAVLSAGETTIKVLCVIDSEQVGRRCAGVPVVADLPTALTYAGADGLDGIILTDTQAPQERFDELDALSKQIGLAPGSIVAPKLLSISSAPMPSGPADTP